MHISEAILANAVVRILRSAEGDPLCGICAAAKEVALEGSQRCVMLKDLLLIANIPNS